MIEVIRSKCGHQWWYLGPLWQWRVTHCTCVHILSTIRLNDHRRKKNTHTHTHQQQRERERERERESDRKRGTAQTARQIDKATQSWTANSQTNIGKADQEWMHWICRQIRQECADYRLLGLFGLLEFDWKEIIYVVSHKAIRVARLIVLEIPGCFSYWD